MNPFLIVRHGARPPFEHYLNEVGKQQAAELGNSVKVLLPDSYLRTYLCYGDYQHGTFKANGQTADIVGAELGMRPEREPLFAADLGRVYSEKDLEGMAHLFEERQLQGPVMCVTSESVIASVAPYFDKKYGFDVGLKIQGISFGTGFMFDFANKKVLFVPKGYSII